MFALSGPPLFVTDDPLSPLYDADVESKRSSGWVRAETIRTLIEASSREEERPKEVAGQDARDSKGRAGGLAERGGEGRRGRAGEGESKRMKREKEIKSASRRKRDEKKIERAEENRTEARRTELKREGGANPNEDRAEEGKRDRERYQDEKERARGFAFVSQ